MSRAIIVAASKRRREEPKDPIPAIDRFQGVYFRILKKYLRERKLPNIDVLIISQNFGVLQAQDKIPYRKPTKTIGFDKETTKRLRKSNLESLENIFKERKYTEVYVNLGKEFTKLIEGFERLTSAKVIYASGPGLGPKAQHMKQYILALTD